LERYRVNVLIFEPVLVGCLIIGLVSAYEAWKKVPPNERLMRVELEGISKFIAFMSLVVVLRLCLFDFLMTVVPKQFLEMFYNSYKTLAQISLWRLALVFWEDAFFVLPMVFMINRFSKWIWIPFVAAMSIVFGMAHGYQGEWAILVTAIYPYFISYRLGKIHGFGTVMLCHILYDVITYFTLHLTPYLIN